jgi:hypothetical protein
VQHKTGAGKPPAPPVVGNARLIAKFDASVK